MFYDYYIWFFLAIIVCVVFAGVANVKVNRAFSKYAKVNNRSGMTGYDTAVRLMRSNDVYDISVGRVRGKLSDHYHPSKKTVNLSESTYGNATVSAVAISAHEIGHVLQNKKGYLFYYIRRLLVPVANVGSFLAIPLVIVGLFMDLFATTSEANTGFYVALIGVALYGTSFLFALVTLPVELNASRRAKKMLLQEGILTQEEIIGAEEVLSAAALTYLAGMLTSLVYFLRFLYYVLAIFGMRGRRR